MIQARLTCQACGTTFTVDLDKDNKNCPQCGSSNTSASQGTTKKIIK